MFLFGNVEECDEETKKQLEYILEQLRSSDTSESSSISDDDEMVEEDIYLEEEIDQHDPVMARHDEVSGFVLLERFYSYKPAVVQLERIASRPESEDPDDRPIRPQTGLVSQSQPSDNTIITTRRGMIANLVAKECFLKFWTETGSEGSLLELLYQLKIYRKNFQEI